MIIGIVIVSLIGFLICIYGFFIERRLKENQNYKAICDLSDKISCTRTFLSPWGSMLGISNIYVGMLFYIGMVLLGLFDVKQLAFIGALGACLASIFFAYILYTRIRILCLVCISVYVVNIVLLIITYRAL